MKHAGTGPVGLWAGPPGVGAGAVPSKVDPIKTIHPLSRQLQQPPALGIPNALVTFLPLCQTSGRPANSPQKIVVDVPSTIDSMETGNTPLRITLKFKTPWRRICAP